MACRAADWASSRFVGPPRPAEGAAGGGASLSGGGWARPAVRGEPGRAEGPALLRPGPWSPALAGRLAGPAWMGAQRAGLGPCGRPGTAASKPGRGREGGGAASGALPRRGGIAHRPRAARVGAPHL